MVIFILLFLSALFIGWMIKLMSINDTMGGWDNLYFQAKKGDILVLEPIQQASIIEKIEPSERWLGTKSFYVYVPTTQQHQYLFTWMNTYPYFNQQNSPKIIIYRPQYLEKLTLSNSEIEQIIHDPNTKKIEITPQ